MHMMFLRKALLLWMILWLPFAGAMAAVMPISGAPSQIAVLASNAQLAAEVESSGDEFVMPCHGKSNAIKASLGQSCSHCVLCHLAGALALGIMPVMPQLPPSHIFVAMPLLPPPSFVPDLPNPPPRPSLA